MKIRICIAVAALALASLASAQPSEYYLWKNKTTGAKVCEPDMPAAQWVKESGPYDDSNCKIKSPT